MTSFRNPGLYSMIFMMRQSCDVSFFYKKCNWVKIIDNNHQVLARVQRSKGFIHNHWQNSI